MTPLAVPEPDHRGHFGQPDVENAHALQRIESRLRVLSNQEARPSLCRTTETGYCPQLGRSRPRGRAPEPHWITGDVTGPLEGPHGAASVEVGLGFGQHHSSPGETPEPADLRHGQGPET